MHLTLLEATPDHVRAGYACPCGCQPAIDYARNAEPVSEGCCCGNEFAVGPDAKGGFTAKAGFLQESQTFDAPWGQQLEAAWLVGPSVHGPASEHGAHDHGASEADASWRTIDPVCGMTVDPEAARAKGLHSRRQETEYFFCGKGCKLEFDEDPDHYLDPAYSPSM